MVKLYEPLWETDEQLALYNDSEVMQEYRKCEWCRIDVRQKGCDRKDKNGTLMHKPIRYQIHII